jgi:hypothetical protein
MAPYSNRRSGTTLRPKIGDGGRAKTFDLRPIASGSHDEASLQEVARLSWRCHLIDFIYGSESSVAGLDAASPTGRAIYAYNVETIASQGVRNRRDYIAKVIDEIAERKPKTEVLAVACGHLRELERCSPTSLRAITRIVGLDHDRRTTN